MKTVKNQPGTMKNQPGTMKNHENLPGTMKNQPGRNKQKRYKQTDTQNLPIIYRLLHLFKKKRNYTLNSDVFQG